MAPEPVWQSNYVDLSDDRTVRFGAVCVICSARYASAGEPLDPAIGASAASGDTPQERIDQLKQEYFAEFDAAFREIGIECYRCQRVACPDCWDVDHHMCAACVATRGLTRSPHRGLPASGPLADGRLQRVEPGRHNDVSRPQWLNQLLAAQSPSASAPAPAGGHGGGTGENEPVKPWMLGLTATGDLARQAIAAGVPLLPNSESMLALEPTARLPQPTPPPAALRGAELGAAASPPVPAQAASSNAFEPAETRASANMVVCPRCGEANYDFVTRCTVCQLQLLQICPMCERLNPGHAQLCEDCGAPLDRPRGWTEVRPAIVPTPHPAASPRKGSSSAKRKAPEPARRARKHPTEKTAVVSAAPTMARSGGGGGTSPRIPVPLPAPIVPDESLSRAELQLDDYAEAGSGGLLHLIDIIAERVLTPVFILIVIALIGGAVLAEFSAQANEAIKNAVHIDVRHTLGGFVDWMQVLYQRLRR